VVLCRPRQGRWRPVRLAAGQRLIGRGLDTPRADRLDPREYEGEFGWVPAMPRGPDLRFRDPPRRERPPSSSAPAPSSPPPSSSTPAPPPSSPPAGPSKRPSGIIERLERGPYTKPPDPVIR
jgi:hypothetical protein